MERFPELNAPPLTLSTPQFVCLDAGSALLCLRLDGSDGRTLSFHLPARIAKSLYRKANLKLQRLQKSAIDFPGRHRPGTAQQPWPSSLRPIRPSWRAASAGKNSATFWPNLQARLQEDVQTQSLTAFRLQGQPFPFPLPRVIGPFNYFDLRASLSQSLFNFKRSRTGTGCTRAFEVRAVQL